MNTIKKMSNCSITIYRRNCQRVFNILCLLIFAVGMGIFLIVMPKYSDDVRFVGIFRDWFSGQHIKFFTYAGNPFVAGIPWEGIVNTWKSLYLGDNARISNVLVTFFIIFPKWIVSPFCWLSLLYTVRVGARILDINLLDSKLTPLFVSGWVIFLPWANQMASLVFQFNYILPSMLSLLVLEGVMGKKSKRGHMSTYIFALLLGFFHEAFSIPFITGLVANMILFKENRNNRQIIIILCMTVGLLYIVTAPSLSNRMSIAVDYNYLSGFVLAVKRFFKIFLWHPVLWMFNFAIIVKIYKNGFQNVFRNQDMTFMFISVWISIFLAYFTTGEPRVVWFGNMMSIFGLVYLIKNSSRITGCFEKKMISISNIVAASIMLFTLGLTDYFVIKTEREFRNAISETLLNPKKAVYNDWLAGYELNPWIHFSKFDIKPYEFIWIAYPAMTDDQLEDNPLRGACMFVPEKLRYYSGKEGKPVPGGGNVRNVDGFLVTEAFPALEEVADGRGWNIPVDFGWGVKPDTGVLFIPFISEKDGKKYIFIRIYNRVLDNLVGNVIYVGKFPGLDKD